MNETLSPRLSLARKFIEYPEQYRYALSELIGHTHWRVIQTSIAGASYRQDALKELQNSDLDTLRLRAVAEPENKFDVFAIRIEAEMPKTGRWEAVGYVPKGLNIEVFYAALHARLDVIAISLGKRSNATNLGMLVGLIETFNGLDQPDLLPQQQTLSEFERELKPIRG